MEENLASHMEYYALKGNFLNKSTNSVNYAEPCLLAHALEDGPLGPWTGHASEQWHSSCCQFPVGFGNMNSVCMWKNHWAVLPNTGHVIHSSLSQGLLWKSRLTACQNLAPCLLFWAPGCRSPAIREKGFQAQQERMQQVRRVLCTQQQCWWPQMNTAE